MSSKYSIGPRTRWRMQTESRPRLSDHIVGGSSEDGPGRWDQRTPAGAVAPETAWERGEDLPEHLLPWFEREDGTQPVQARLWAEIVDGEWYAVVFLVSERPDRCATTILRVNSIWDRDKRAYLNARAAGFIEERGADD